MNESNNTRDPLLKLPSARSLATHGVARSIATYIQNNHWTLQPEFRDIFSTYYMLRWRPAHFVANLEDGTISREGITYQVIYHKTDSAAITKTDSDLLLSFRELDKTYKTFPTVLVTIAGPKRGN